MTLSLHTRNQAVSHCLSRRLMIALALAGLLLSCIATPQAWASESGTTTDPGITWTLDDDGTLAVAGAGEVPDNSFNALKPTATSADLCAKIRSVRLGPEIIGVGTYAFRGCINLARLEAQGTISVGKSAFRDCVSLATVPPSTVFSKLAGYAFRGCTALAGTSVSVLGSAEITSNAFDGISPKPTITWIGTKSGSFGDTSWTFEDGALTIIGTQAGKINTSLRIKDIEPSDVTSIELPDGLTAVSDGAFSGFSSITSITIPASTSTIGSGAFASCLSLREVELEGEGANLTEIGAGAFMACPSLKELNLSHTQITSLGSGLFNGSSAGPEFVESGIERLVLPPALTSLGEGVLSGASNLKTLVLPEGVTSIGPYALQATTALRTLALPASIQTIDALAFGTTAAQIQDVDIVVTGAAPDATNPAVEAFGSRVHSITYQPSEEERPTYVIDPVNGVTVVDESTGTAVHYRIGAYGPLALGSEADRAFRTFIGDAGSILAAWDVKLLDEDGNEASDLGKPLTVTIPVEGAEEGEQLDVYVRHGDASTPSTAAPALLTTARVVDGSVTFDTPGLSSFAVVRGATVKLAFDAAGGSAVPSQSLDYGATPERPADPSRAGYEFTGWYADESLARPFDFSQPLTADAEAYAGWKKAAALPMPWGGSGSSQSAVHPGGAPDGGGAGNGGAAAASEIGRQLARTSDNVGEGTALLVLAALASAATAGAALSRRRSQR